MHLLVILLQHLLGLLSGASQAPKAQVVPAELPEIAGAQPAVSQASQLGQASQFSECRWMTIDFEEVWRFGGWALPGSRAQHSPVPCHQDGWHLTRRRAVTLELSARQAASAWQRALACYSAGLDSLAGFCGGEFSRRANNLAGRFAVSHEKAPHEAVPHESVSHEALPHVVESPQISGSGSSGN
jgi:hypothetical protein